MMARRGVKLGCVVFTTSIVLCMGTLFVHECQAAERKTVVWEVSLSHPPYECLNPDGSLSGLAVEMGRALPGQATYPYYRLLQESYTNVKSFPGPEDAARALATPSYRELVSGYTLDADGHARAPLFWIVCTAVLAVFLISVTWRWWRRYRKLEGTLKQITDIYNESKEKLQIAIANAQNGLFVFKSESVPLLSKRLKILLIITEETPSSMGEFVAHLIGVSYPSFHGLLIALQDKVIGQATFDETLCVRLFKEGEAEYWIHMHIHAYPHQDGMIYTGYCQDVSKERLLEQRLAFFEDHDYLTGLLNARRLVQLGEQVLAHCAKSGKIFAALFLDLYNFKDVNHQYGQRYGDRLLQQTATRIQEALPTTSLFARMGGDKFIVLLSHMEEQQEALDIVSRIIRGVNAMECRELSLNTNVGISFFPAHGDAVIHLITCAEKAAEAAKQKGAGQYAVYQTQDTCPMN